MSVKHISLADYDEARAQFFEQLAASSASGAEPDEAARAEHLAAAAATREAAEHADDWIEIEWERPFGAVLDEREVVLAGRFGERTVALLRNVVVRWQIGERSGERVDDEWIRSLPGELGLWLEGVVRDHYERVRRSAPKVTRAST